MILQTTNIKNFTTKKSVAVSLHKKVLHLLKLPRCFQLIKTVSLHIVEGTDKKN